MTDGKGFDRLQQIRRHVADVAKLPLSDHRVVGAAGLMMQHELLTARQCDGEDVDTSALMMLTKAIADAMPTPPADPVEVRVEFIGPPDEAPLDAAAVDRVIECRHCHWKPFDGDRVTRCYRCGWRQGVDDHWHKFESQIPPLKRDDVSSPTAVASGVDPVVKPPHDDVGSATPFDPHARREPVKHRPVVSNIGAWMGGFSGDSRAPGGRDPNPFRNG